MSMVLALEHVSYSYRDGGRKLEVLKDVSVSFAAGTLSVILGPSGSGKTTLLALAAALDTPHSGQVLYDGHDIRELGLQIHRRRHVALVFQSYNLLTYMSALENVTMAMDIAGSYPGQRKQRAMELLEQVGLSRHEAQRRVTHLSGGQQQRVAVARALASDAPIILADEPTGNLDSATAHDIITLFQRVAHELGKCVVVVTHSQELANQADKVYCISDGVLQAV